MAGLLIVGMTVVSILRFLMSRLVTGPLMDNIAISCQNRSFSKGLWGSLWLSNSTTISLVDFKKLRLTANLVRDPLPSLMEYWMWNIVDNMQYIVQNRYSISIWYLVTHSLFNDMSSTVIGWLKTTIDAMPVPKKTPNSMLKYRGLEWKLFG